MLFETVTSTIKKLNDQARKSTWPVLNAQSSCLKSDEQKLYFEEKKSEIKNDHKNNWQTSRSLGMLVTAGYYLKNH